MRRALLAAVAALAVALLAGCGGSGGETGRLGDATVTVPSGDTGIEAELTAILDQFPYQRWYTSCVEKRFDRALTPEEEEALSDLSDTGREERLNELIGKVGPACEGSSDRPLVDPDASTGELDLLRADMVPTVGRLAESEGLDAGQADCVTDAFEKLPDRFVVKFGNGDEGTRGSILLTVFRTCVEANRAR